MKEDKFYYIKPVQHTYITSRAPYLEKLNKDYSVVVDEEVDHHQHITITLNKLNQKDFDKPVSTEYEKVKPVIPEIFYEHYNFALKHIHEAELDEGECYQVQHSKDWIEWRYFSKNEKQKTRLEIDLRDSIEDLWLTVSCYPGHKNRPQSRKEGKPIPVEDFRKFLQCTIKFLYDSNSLLIFRDDYLNNMRSLAAGDDKLIRWQPGIGFSPDKIIEQLNLRKITLEKRLIENDNDSALDRAKIRGEIEGIIYAIAAISQSR